MAQKTNKKQNKKKKNKAKSKNKKFFKNNHIKKNILFTVLKWIFILIIWFFIFVIGLVAWYGSEIPDIIDTPQFKRKHTVLIKDRYGNKLTRYGELKGVSIDTKDMPPHLIYAVIATEDRRFYSHHGIDWQGIARAMYVNIKNRRLSQGGSTITQQLAKNLFLSHDRTFKRKIQEAMLAIWLERTLSKDEILSAYLNRVYFGSSAYGVDAAARIYFDKPAKDLTLNESALIAGLLKAPSRYSPLVNPDKAKARTEIVLKLMDDQGYKTDKDNPPLQLQASKLPGEETIEDNHHYFADWIMARITEDMEFGSQDIIVETTLDKTLQRRADEIMQDELNNYKDRKVSQAAYIVLSYSGEILAMGGGRNYNLSQFNRATQAVRPPGSAFKPFVYLAALENGWSEHDLIDDSPITTGQYKPQNFSNEYWGDISLREALTYSKNTATVKLAKMVGISKTIQTAKKFGIKSELEPDLSLALGSSGVPLIDMAQAYAGFGNGGYKVNPYGLTSIQKQDGAMLYEYQKDNSNAQLTSSVAIQQLNYMLENVIIKGTGKSAKLPYATAAGKTGTSQDYRDAWFVGYDDRFIVAVWTGNDDNSETDKITGGSLPAHIWRRIMISANNNLKLRDSVHITEEKESEPKKQHRRFKRVLNQFKFND